MGTELNHPSPEGLAGGRRQGAALRSVPPSPDRRPSDQCGSGGREAAEDGTAQRSDPPAQTAHGEQSTGARPMGRQRGDLTLETFVSHRRHLSSSPTLLLSSSPPLLLLLLLLLLLPVPRWAVEWKAVGVEGLEVEALLSGAPGEALSALGLIACSMER